jgi:hypothetical protein
MIWLRILCNAIGRMIWFALGGAVYGLFYGWIIGMLIVPLLTLFFTAAQGALVNSGSVLVDGFVAGLLVGAWVAALGGGFSMGVVGFMQGFRPHRSPLDEDFNRHFIGLFWGGFWCALAGFFTGGVLIGVALLQTGKWGNANTIESEMLSYWVLACYFGGSLFGAVSPDALGNFWRNIKAVLPEKSGSVSATQNGVED